MRVYVSYLLLTSNNLLEWVLLCLMVILVFIHDIF